MNGRILLGTVAGLVLGCALSSSAQEKGYWVAASSTAKSITGDISISDTKVTINFAGFIIAQIRKMESAEVNAVFASESGGGANGNLYRLNIPAKQRFLHHNSLCGSDDVQWMVTSVDDRSLRVAFFSGVNTPVFTPEALANSTDLCGTFTYVR